jgi:(1->4)-alpha-D-glucan 1-alpha-D-glucosylmutase
VPDVYQGTETWDLSLVDPDNRRAVDFAGREALLEALPGEPSWKALAESWPDGRLKAALMQRLLAWRAERAAVYTGGAYQPLWVSGRDADHVLAFARTLRRAADIIVVARNFAPFTEGGRLWPDFRGLQATIHCTGFLPQRVAVGTAAAPKGDTLSVRALLGPLPFAVVTALKAGDVAADLASAPALSA